MDTNNLNEEELNKQFEQTFGPPAAQQGMGFVPGGAQIPNSSAALVLGIIGAFFALIWCYWFGSLIGLVCSIIAIVQAKKAITIYEASPGSFKPSSIGNAKAGRVLGIVGLCLGALGFIGLIIFAVIIASIGSVGWH